jgi:hypothetical protein
MSATIGGSEAEADVPRASRDAGDSLSSLLMIASARSERRFVGVLGERRSLHRHPQFQRQRFQDRLHLGRVLARQRPSARDSPGSAGSIQSRRRWPCSASSKARSASRPSMASTVCAGVPDGTVTVTVKMVRNPTGCRTSSACGRRGTPWACRRRRRARSSATSLVATEDAKGEAAVLPLPAPASGPPHACACLSPSLPTLRPERG